MPQLKLKQIASKRAPADLQEIQRLMSAVISRRLTAGDNLQRRWTDGRQMQDVASDFIKPNDRLTSFERLQIYNQQYWFRLIDCLYDDFPGLEAILGEKKFNVLIKSYLERYPSTSFTLRDLGSRLEQFLLEEPHWSSPHEKLALDMVRLEWAKVVAFDGPSTSTIEANSIKGQDPSSLRFKLQPYITLLEMDYPLDDFSIALKKAETVRTEASTGQTCHRKSQQRVARPKPKKTYTAVHRFNNTIFYKDLAPNAFVLLQALKDGKPLGEACAESIAITADADDFAFKLSEWFTEWTELGWFCQAEELTLDE